MNAYRAIGTLIARYSQQPSVQQCEHEDLPSEEYCLLSDVLHDLRDLEETLEVSVSKPFEALQRDIPMVLNIDDQKCVLRSVVIQLLRELGMDHAKDIAFQIFMEQHGFTDPDYASCDLFDEASS